MTGNPDRIWEMRGRTAKSSFWRDGKILAISSTLTKCGEPVALNLKFSHHYPKVNNQTSARLIAVELKNRKDLHPKFVLYDTHFIDKYETEVAFDGYYTLPNGLCLVLYFIGNYGIPFCTVRRATGEKELYYRKQMGKEFSIIVNLEPVDLPDAVQIDWTKENGRNDLLGGSPVTGQREGRGEKHLPGLQQPNETSTQTIG